MQERLAFWEIYEGYGWTRFFVYGLSIIAVAIFAYGVWTRVKLWRAGRKPDKPRLDQMGQRIVNLIKYALVQAKVFKEIYPGVMHAFIFFGFVVLFIGTATTVLDEDLYRLISGEKFIEGAFYVGFSFLLDLFGVLAIIGLGLAAYRRYVTKPDRLDNKRDDAVVLVLIALILVTGFLSEAGRIAHGLNVPAGTQFTEEGVNPDYAAFEPLASPVGYVLALGLKGMGENGAAVFHKVIWFLHLFLGLGFVAVIPYTKLWHIVASSANIYSSNLEHAGDVVAIDNLISKMENDQIERLGYDRIADFTPKQLLMLDACTRCGRCQAACPAHNTQKPLSPKQFIQDFKAYWDQKTQEAAAKAVEGEAAAEPAAPAEYDPEPFLNEVVKPKVAWSCTTCMACMEACPVMIEHLSLINEVRRALVFNMIMPSEGSGFLKNMTNNMNPWGMNPGDRQNWTEGLDIPNAAEGEFDVLLWVGCMGAYDARAQKVSQAVVKILRAAGIKFAILGNDESCCGDSARRLGEEGLFQMIAMQNIEIMNGLGVKKILTTCPHGYNTLKHEYAKLGGNYEVVHHAEFIAELINSGKIKVKGNGLAGKSAVFHDSCYLGRYNGIYEQPRQALSAAGLKVTDIERSRNNGFCCGGGGGLMWLEEHAPKINVTRVEQMMEAKPNVLCSACPFCLTMFDEAYKFKGYDEQGVELYDLAEIVAKALPQ